MRIKHVVPMYVNDLEGARDFFCSFVCHFLFYGLIV